VEVLVCDVGPRDGLQNEERVLEPAVRAKLVNRLAATGLRRIEAVSFVSPKWVPQMAGAEEVVAAIERRDGTENSGLVLNEQGYLRLAQTGLDRVNSAVAATESFNQRNANASLEQAAQRVETILSASERPVTVTISSAFGCPFEGRVDPGVVAGLAERFPAASEVVLSDTIGVGTQTHVRRPVDRIVPLGKPIGFHGHDTRNTAVACAYAALEGGATVFDASVGGLGGCPFAPRATGNVATEDLLYMLEGEGVETGVDLDAVLEVARWFEGVLGKELPSRVYRAGPFPSRTAPEAASSATSSSE
jgi:isopropylmalate/homocitrate/citramalate synthase